MFRCDASHSARDLSRKSYDFSCGEWRTSFCFSVDGIEARVEVLTLCVRSQPSLALQEITVEATDACDLTLVATIDPTELRGQMLARFPSVPGEPNSAVDGTLLWEPFGGLSTCGAAYSTEFLGEADVSRSKSQSDDQGPLATYHTFHAVPGERYRLRQIGGLLPSASHHQPQLEAARLVALGSKIGFDELRRRNRENWEEIWKGRVRLLGADRRWQALADAAFYYLQSSVHSSSIASTSIFGMAQWPTYHYYYGHIMWDLESFAVPPLLLTQPDAAHAMLEYRSRSLNAARHNARLHGYRGAQFPWESGPVYGEEAAPGATAGGFEEHAGLSVALACAQYVHATGDAHFEREQAWPILCGVADWIASRVTRTPRGYEIRRTMGLAEREQPSDNIAYVNMAASMVLCEAANCARQLGYSAPETWETIARHLRIPCDRRTQVILNHDSYQPSEKKGATPGALAGLFPVGYPLPRRKEGATLRYYLDRADEYIGNPMLSALYGVWAARLGDRKRSAQLFEAGYAQFVCERFMDTHEYRDDEFPDQPPAGPFFANLCGFLLGCLYGLPGVRLGPGIPSSWCERPVVMPEGWDGIEVERIWVRRHPAHLLARHGDTRATIEVLEK